MAYRYVAYTATGEMKEGVVEVNSEQAAEEALWRSDMTIVELRPIGPSLAIEELLPSLYAIRKRDIIVFSRQLANLLGSGIAILPAIRLLQEETTKKLLAKVLGQVIEDIQQGASLSQAFSRHPQVFPPLFIRLIETGEQTGNVEEILKRLADYMEKEEALIRKIRGALTYPAIIITLAVAVMLLFVNFVLPSMTGLFTEFKAELPLPTRLLLGGSNLIQSNFIQILVALALLVGGGLWYRHTPQGRRQTDYVLLTKIPLVKTVTSKGSMARLASVLAMLLGAGLPLTEIMELLLRTTQNTALQEALEQVRTDVLAGMAMSEALARHSIFPPMLGQIVKVGEETGALADNLLTLARFYEEETDRAVTAMTAMIEPLLIVGIGGFIAFLAISIISPMYSILQTIK